MNQILVGGFALLLALAIWSTGKKSSKTAFTPKQNDYLPIGTRQDISLITSSKVILQKNQNYNQETTFSGHKPSTREKIILKKKLSQLLSGGPDERLDAIKIASEWHSKESIPFIRKGLQDFDSRVVIAAAAAIARFKGNKKPLKRQIQSLRPPRNVSLMR